jgi:hypothetical protein
MAKEVPPELALPERELDLDAEQRVRLANPQRHRV